MGFPSTADPHTLLQIANNSVGIVGAAQYAEIVVKYARARRLQGLCRETSESLASFADPYDTAESLKAALASIDLPVVGGQQQAQTLEEIIDTAEDMSPWVIPGLLRVDWRVVVVGLEGHGKSTLLRQIAAMSAQGLHPLKDITIEPIRALIVDLENPRAAIAETGKSLVAQLRRTVGDAYDPGRLRVFRKPGGLDLRTRHDRTELERELTLHKPNLVTLGPAYKMTPKRAQRGGLESHEEAVDPVLAILDDLRTRHGFALMIEQHAPEGHQGPRDLRPYGGQRWRAWPEMGIFNAAGQFTTGFVRPQALPG